MMLWSSYQSVQDPPALVIGAVVREEGPVDQNQAVEEDPGAEPEQGEDQRAPPAESEAQPAQHAAPPRSTPCWGINHSPV